MVSFANVGSKRAMFLPFLSSKLLYSMPSNPKVLGQDLCWDVVKMRLIVGHGLRKGKSDVAPNAGLLGGGVRRTSAVRVGRLQPQTRGSMGAVHQPAIAKRLELGKRNEGADPRAHF